MATPAEQPSQQQHDDQDSGAPIRSDAMQSRQSILRAASMLKDRRVTMAELAAAARVGRSTLYRHFPTRHALEQALEEVERDSLTGDAKAVVTGRVTTLPFTAPGQLGRARPLALEVTRILEEVPPHLVPDQLVAEARRA